MSYLAPRERIEHFLKELANSRLDTKAGTRLRRMFPEFLSGLGTLTSRYDDDGWAHWIEPLRRVLHTKGTALDALAAGVRGVWAEPDARAREWHLFLLRLSLADALEFDDIRQSPPLTPLDQALSYLQREGRLAKRCANRDCERTARGRTGPFFFADRSTGKYCCDECAAPAKRAAKLRWWDEHKKNRPSRAKRKRTHGRK